MKVQIIKAASPLFWYSRHIDQIFEVVDKGDNYMLKEDAENGKVLIINRYILFGLLMSSCNICVSRKQNEMKKTKPLILQSLFISAIFFFLGFFYYKTIFSFFEPQIPGITFEIISIERPLKTSFLFSLVFCLIPLAIASLWLLLSLSKIKRFISLAIISSCISFSIFLRQQAVLHYFKSIVTTLLLAKKTKNFLYPIDPRHFVYNIIIGFFVGCFISCFLTFSRKNKKYASG